MAKNQARRIASAVLSDDREAFAALQGITNYAPANPAYKTENIKAIRDRMDDLLREATQAEVAAEAKRAAANAGEWEFHNSIARRGSLKSAYALPKLPSAFPSPRRSFISRAIVSCCS